MPGGDRTGPEGQGPFTGRGSGDCGPVEQPRFGFGGWFRRGRGWRHWARATGKPGWLRFGGWGTPQAPMDESAMLKSQAEQLQARMDEVQRRLAEIEKE